ncbi:hypothetical protein GA0116948_11233 [Chitinophaga costaii]|uniref:Uncharacterized protein n=1 Tax=Chitinophaga costaii TaxID=1335309 RepID=A0A1C4F7B9_9BACT|nr:hypothetical protein GA0116948_11233 [Chitinophaga costaii]
MYPLSFEKIAIATVIHVLTIMIAASPLPQPLAQVAQNKALIHSTLYTVHGTFFYLYKYVH